MKVDQDLSNTKLECGCEVNAWARIDPLVLTRTPQSRKGNKKDHGCVESPEQWRNR